MHCSPSPAHASFRLITALRLHHSFPAGVASGSEEDMTTAAKRWRHTIWGYKDVVSEENERACKGSIGEICAVVIKRAETGIKAVKEEMRMEREEWYRKVLGDVRFLWLEELAVSEAMLQALEALIA
jgi:hypothetical protein